MIPSEKGPLDRLLAFIERLDGSKIHYRLEHVRDSIMVMVDVPGERWEIEFFGDGQIEIERFYSSGEISHQQGLLEDLLNTNAS